ncbi:hypothetical protein G6L46_10925 [Agrobacterium rhizogenes]|uniref:hypothetical protein n=1 Tax=Rhizobium rhizogenes TaxID=359 RepID=UPI001572D20B|nr:hypothetical protein [Rhizobium rhizogenes]NTF87637.1 hypothetical protein [Rhizobium rhizogenes]
MQTLSFIEECCWQPDSGWSGKLIATYAEMKATLSGFETRAGFTGFQKGNVELTLASGETATLLDCRGGLPGSVATATKHLAHTELVPSYLLVGDRRWTDNDLVESMEFCLPDARTSLSFGDHREMHVEEEEGEAVLVSKTHLSRTEVGCIELPDYEVRISVQKSLSRATKDEVGRDPVWFLVKFAKPYRLYATFQIPFHITTFFELSVGRPLTPRGFVIKSYRDTPLAPNYAQVDDFEFYRTEDPVERSEHQHHEPVFTIRREEDRKTTLEALRIWLNRRRDWEVTYWLASQFVHGGRQVNRSNMLRAMAWFESIPTYQSVSTINEKSLKIFSRECREMDSFKALGIAPERLNEVLNELHRAPLNSRIQLAIADINRYMQSDFLREPFYEDCKKAKKMRDKAAHGGDASLEEDFGEVVTATFAIETLAFLSTICLLGGDPRKIRSIMNWAWPHPYAGYFGMKQTSQHEE